MRISDWSSDVCSSDLARHREAGADRKGEDAILRIGARDRLGHRDHGRFRRRIMPVRRAVAAIGGAARDVDDAAARLFTWRAARSEEHTSELQSLMRISYAVFCLKKKKTNTQTTQINDR